MSLDQKLLQEYSSKLTNRKPATVEKNLTIFPMPWIRLFIFLTDCGSDIHFIT